MKVNVKRAAAAGVLCLGLVAAAASAGAQDRGPGPRGGGRMAEHQKMFEQMRQKREQRLHDLLQIRPEQEGAFKAFLAGVEPQLRLGDRRPGGPDGKAMTTPERLDRMAQRMAERQQRFQKIAAATRTFYAALNTDQRKAFDAMPMMGRGGGFGGHDHHGFGPGGPGRGPDGPPPPPPGR